MKKQSLTKRNIHEHLIPIAPDIAKASPAPTFRAAVLYCGFAKSRDGVEGVMVLGEIDGCTLLQSFCSECALKPPR